LLALMWVFDLCGTTMSAGFRIAGFALAFVLVLYSPSLSPAVFAVRFVGPAGLLCLLFSNDWIGVAPSTDDPDCDR